MLRRTDAGVAVLTRAGFTPEQAAIILTVFANYTMGFILREYTAAEDEEDIATINASVARLGAAELPVLSEVTTTEPCVPSAMSSSSSACACFCRACGTNSKYRMSRRRKKAPPKDEHAHAHAHEVVTVCCDART